MSRTAARTIGFTADLRRLDVWSAGGGTCGATRLRRILSSVATRVNRKDFRVSQWVRRRGGLWSGGTAVAQTLADELLEETSRAGCQTHAQAHRTLCARRAPRG